VSRRLRTWLVALAVAALVTAANGSQGGYFSQSWGWIALAFVAAVSLTLIVGWAVRPGRLRVAFSASMTALGVWVALSATWSVTPAGSLRELERVLVYVALSAAVALVLRRGDAAGLAAGVFAGSVAVAGYGLATRLFPDRLESYDSPTLPYRLAEPIGYWNALGLLAAMGVLLGVGIVAHGRHVRYAALAAATLPVLAATLYFTFSRGAWLALAAGVVAMLVLDGRRLRLTWMMLAVAPISAVCVALASRQDALTTEDAPRADAVTEGERLALVVAGLMIGSGMVAVGARWVARRVPVPRWAPSALDAAYVGLALVAIVTAVVLAGGPRDALAEIEARFDTPVTVESANLNDRLFSVSGNTRAVYVELAWDAGRERPLLGHGAGSYEYLWYERRPDQSTVRDAHSVYAETFAELGLVGVSLLGVALLVPVVAAVRARRNRYVPAAAAALAAWTVQAALDWHWEVVGVTATALLAGAVALLAAERGSARPLADVARWPLLAGSVVLTVLALVSLVGNQALFAARDALARGDLEEAREHADRAEALLPWSFEPHYVLGDTAGRRGDRVGALRAYREAVATDGSNWIAWLRLAQVARGAERRAAYARIHELNPREEDLAGETAVGETP
jgi:O-Antigen ligase